MTAVATPIEAALALARRVLQLGNTALCDAFAGHRSAARSIMISRVILEHVSLSGERNKWRPRRRRRFTKQLLLDARGQARLDVPVAALRVVEGAFGVRCDVDASAVFVTSQGLRTPLHSDPKASLTVYVSGPRGVSAHPRRRNPTLAQNASRSFCVADDAGQQRRLYLGDDASSALGAVST